jgi:hypothetical protein
MGNISKISHFCELGADFDLTILPLFDARPATRKPATQNPVPPTVTNNISRLGLNIYSPQKKIPSYENLLCREMARRQNEYDTHQTISSFWFSGYPLKQLTPEAITELCFRFSNHFSHGTAHKAMRGISTTTSELNKQTLALLAGLHFNCIELTVDASIAGNDRSLDKLKAVVALTEDYGQIKLMFRVRTGDHTHPDFLARLLAHITDIPCQQVEIVCAGVMRDAAQAGLGALRSTQRLLQQTLRFFRALNWANCGNNFFFPPDHPLSVLRRQKKLFFTPWGYQNRIDQTMLGLGVNGLSLINGEYQRNCANPETYRQCVSENTPLPITRYTLDNQFDDLYASLQALLCFHDISTPFQDNNPLEQLIDKGWVDTSSVNRERSLSLSEDGLIHLTQVCELLYPPRKYPPQKNDSYNVSTRKKDGYNVSTKPELQG